jgi:tetratricopeptide (TPR) repeat protein
MKKLVFTTILFLSLQSPTFAGDLVELGPQPLLMQGIAAYQRGNYTEALKYLTARARIQPGDARAFYFLGNTYLQLNNYDEAAHQFTACVKTSPNSQAGQYSLQALERLSTMPKKGPDLDKDKNKDGQLTPEQIEATRDSMRSDRALDKDFNEAAKRIQNERITLKRRIDQIYDRLTEELAQLNRRSTPNFYAELAQTKSKAEMEVEQLQKKQQRWEARLLAPDKVDVRAVPELKTKKDDSKDALGALAEYFKPEKPNDPLATDITPEITAKFMTMRDVFGDLSTYEPQSRRLAKQMFGQLKSSIEMKQDSFDSQVHNEKDRLIRDVYSIQANYQNQSFGRNTSNPMSYLTSSSIPRSSQENLSPMELDISQAAERTKKRLKELQDNYARDVDGMISGTKERLGSLIGTTATMGSQLKKPKGVIQIVPLGTTLNNRNYVNFGDRDTPSK